MLKALQLLGFKSFADKTRFEFPPGITVVVGPNGSGKSNIVDGIKWVLGEQSVKSLRGKEMADVIFNGSGTRRVMNSAEIVLTFDNSDSRLPIETPEVHVGRRVYRSGEGEYLINGQPCRLRDIRDMFDGTGVSTQHYSIIEQGKVDSMLQASPRDRRLIFEEAAGISRFKAKKLETLRRLERVEQNLLRLSDIVDEVEGRLRSVRSQAGKARRYREYTDSLQALRTQVGSSDWRRLSRQIGEFETRLATLRDESVESAAKNASLESRSLQLDDEIEAAEKTIHESEQETAENRERIAACESTIEHERTRRRDLDQEIQRRQNELSSMSSRTRDVGSQLESTLRDVAVAESRFRQVREQVAEIDRGLVALDDQLEQLHSDHEKRRGEHVQMLRRHGELEGEINSIESTLRSSTAALARSRQKLAQLETARSETDAEFARLQSEMNQAAAKLGQCEHDFADAREHFSSQQSQLADAQQQLAQLRSQFSGVRERAAVLEELQRRQEGLNSGVKEVLAKATLATEGAFKQIVGLVADVLEVQIEMAPLIETALGDRSGYLVVQPGGEFEDFLDREAHPFGGRVGFVPAAAPPNRELGGESIDLEGKPGVIGRADRFVSTSPQCEPLAERLLGATWIVADLSRARALADISIGQNFVTLAGQYLAADGTLCVGPKQGTTGLISRRAELRELRSRLEDLTEKLELNEGAVERLSETVADASARLESLTDQRESLRKDVSEIGRRLSATEERKVQLEDSYQTTSDALERSRQQSDVAAARLKTIQDLCAEIEQAVGDLESAIERDQRQIKELEARRQQFSGEATAGKVELARCEQQLDHLAKRQQQYEQDQQERNRAIDEAANQLDEATRRAEDCDRRILQIGSEVSELYLRKEALSQSTVSLSESRETLRAERGTLHIETQNIRGAMRKVEQEIHNFELQLNQVQLERDTLETRMREDYGIELSNLQDEATEEELKEREAIENEIEGLRRKVQNIGNVNLDALDELDELESRFEELSGQYRDLSEAKKSLEQIIDRINTDSRRLFIETLESVRGHFQSLFRKLFGGGQADIVMDDEEDILESGLEIVARPPGKEPRSISLLSGGEKTLTCVALLMAIFRNRPSPFCVLDEVDAALDEANIERFMAVLQDFLQWTQFIVVTHSKKTMTCANTLYGVTMQESGISKRVSVRFEDVSETGEILRTRDDDEEAGDGDGTQAA
ncbi:MAG: chromosome segregation protein SMC [Pirellulales bacterium]